MPDATGRRRRRARAGTSAAVLGLLLAAPLAPAAPAAASTTATARVVVAPDRDGVLHPGDGLGLDLAITNPGTATLPAGSVGIGLDPAPPSGVAALTDRLAHPAVTGYLVATAKTPAVAPGRTEHLHVSVPAATVTGTIGAESGARLVNASLSAGGSQAAIGSAAVTWLGGRGLPQVGVTTLLPLTAPATETGLVTDPDALTALVAPDGAWGRALKAAEADRSAVVALDPAVLASIRLLDKRTPQQARDFLEALRGLDNEQLELPYADGDLALQRAAGLSRVLGPTSFRNALAAPAPVASGSPTPTASPTPAATTAPSVRDLLDWRYTAPKVAWPVAGTARMEDLGMAAASGYRATILAGGNVRDTAARRKAGPLARVGARPVLVADAAGSALLTAAGAGRPGALASLLALLATDASSGDASQVLVAVDRAGGGEQLPRALRALRSQPFLDARGLGELLEAHAPASIRLAPAPAVRRAERARDLVHGEAAVRHLGTAVQDPAPLTGPERLALLGLLSAAWRSSDADWPAAADRGVQRFRRALEQVRIDQGGDVNYIGGSGALPVTVINNLQQPVTVVLHGTPSNSRLTVEGSRRATIPAESSLPVSLPVRSISNGQVELQVSITTSSGWVISRRSVQINVAAGWETVGGLVFGLGLAALLGIGLYRNLIRRRRPRERSA